MNNDFEEFWAINRQRLLNEDEEYRRVRDSYKMTTGADLLLYAIPLVAAVCVLDWAPTGRELLNWLIAAAAAVVAFVVCTWVKALTVGERPISEIEAEIKEREKAKFEKENARK